MSTSSPTSRSRVYFTWRKTLSNLAALLAFAVCAFLGILGESVGTSQIRHLCAFGLGALGYCANSMRTVFPRCSSM